MAKEPSDISFRKGDLIRVMARDESGWAEGTLENGITGGDLRRSASDREFIAGTFPETYVAPFTVRRPVPARGST